MVQRVSTPGIALQMQEALRRSQLRRFDASAQLSSGKLISKYSDNPADAAAIVRLGAEQSDLEAFAKAADDSVAWLNTADTALQRASNILQRVRELTLSAANDPRGPTEREGIARELETLRDELATVSETTYLGHKVFAGFGSAAVTQVAGVWTFTGDSGQVQRRVGPNTVVTTNVDGSVAFGFAAGADAFTMIDDIASSVRTGDSAAVAAHLDTIQGRLDDVTGALAEVGARTNLVERTRAQGDEQFDNIRQNRSLLEDADIAASVLSLTEAQRGYEATLSAVARTQQTSLLDFLR